MSGSKTEMEMFEVGTAFSTPDGGRVVLRDWLDRYVVRDPERELFVGTDSKNGSRTNFTTVLVSRLPGKGGVYVYRRYWRRKIGVLRHRLSIECWNSIYLAILADEYLRGQGRDAEITVHLDVSSNVRFSEMPGAKSGRYMAELVGCVVGQGFGCKVKPEAFAASGIADHVVRGKR